MRDKDTAFYMVDDGGWESPGFETLMCQGNGYMGIRACFEEDYVFQKRGAFIAGLYNSAMPGEVAELPNCPDMVAMGIWLDGQRFSMDKGVIHSYSRSLNMADGELVRDLVWQSPAGRSYAMVFRRFVPLDNLHLMCCSVQVTALDADGVMAVETGIDGSMTNSGSQHFIEGDKRVFDKKVLHAQFVASQTGVCVNTVCAVRSGGRYMPALVGNGRRRIWGGYEFALPKGEPVCFEKLSLYYKNDDAGAEALPGHNPAVEAVEGLESASYGSLLKASAGKWADFWKSAGITLEAEEGVRRKVNAALYHMRIMTFFGNGNVSIGAKGLTGEGYRGHVFWDTEMFMLPFFIHTFPEQARELLIYRWQRLPQARGKAARYGYGGAMFPWESAAAGDEETPEYAALNIETGQPTPIPNPTKEIHITADIAYMAMRYYLMTGDKAFMLDYGCELVLACGLFWASRCEKTGRGYELRDVIGPDEYTEGIDNNTYTNHMVRRALEYACECAGLLAASPVHEAVVEGRWQYKSQLGHMRGVAENIYFAPAQNGITPQDESFLSKRDIDVSKYAAVAGSQAILKDYTREQVIDMQVLKQADLAMLYYLEPDEWGVDERIRNLRYYERRTIHDSSLSKCIYGITAMDAGLEDMIEDFFLSSLDVDMGSGAARQDGIHAASMFGIWNLLIRGACGAGMGKDGLLKLKCALPPCIKSINARIAFQGRRIQLEAKAGEIKASLIDGEGIDVNIYCKAADEWQRITLNKETAI